MLQCAVPARFQLAGNMTFGRIDQLVSASGEGRLVSCALKLPRHRRNDVLARALHLFGREGCRLYGTVGHGVKNLQGDGTIDPNPTNADAQPRANMGVIAAALIAMSV